MMDSRGQGQNGRGAKVYHSKLSRSSCTVSGYTSYLYVSTLPTDQPRFDYDGRRMLSDRLLSDRLLGRLTCVAERDAVNGLPELQADEKMTVNEACGMVIEAFTILYEHDRLLF